ncbi:MAG: hypothetical protein IJT95_05265 [Abditibacteriota bacterium]|nr:hypothetical protein [Abditibacteriota bacterium]
MDAEAANDGSGLKFIVHLGNTVRVYWYDLNEKDWTDKYYIGVCDIFRESTHGFRYPLGLVKQAYFVTPDDILISTNTGIEYGIRIYRDKENARRETERILKSRKSKKRSYQYQALSTRAWYTGTESEMNGTLRDSGAAGLQKETG